MSKATRRAWRNQQARTAHEKQLAEIVEQKARDQRLEDLQAKSGDVLRELTRGVVR